MAFQQLAFVAIAAVLYLGSQFANAQTVPSLGRAAGFGALAQAGITTTGGTVIHGDAGSFPTGTITGFGPGSGQVVQGTLHTAPDVPTQNAVLDAGTAYTTFAAMRCNTNVSVSANTLEVNSAVT